MFATSVTAASGAVPDTWTRSLGDLDAELQELAVDPGSAPQRAFAALATDEGTDIVWDRWASASAPPRLPRPVQSEAFSVPADDGFRLHDRCAVQGYSMAVLSATSATIERKWVCLVIHESSASEIRSDRFFACILRSILPVLWVFSPQLISIMWQVPRFAPAAVVLD